MSNIQKMIKNCWLNQIEIVKRRSLVSRNSIKSSQKESWIINNFSRHRHRHRLVCGMENRDGSGNLYRRRCSHSIELIVLPHREILWNKNKFQFSLLLFVSFKTRTFVLCRRRFYSVVFPSIKIYIFVSERCESESLCSCFMFPDILSTCVFYFCSEKSEIFIGRPWKEGKKQWRLPICRDVDDDTSTQILTFSVYCHFTVHTMLTEPNWSSIHRVTSQYTIQYVRIMKNCWMVCGSTENENLFGIARDYCWRAVVFRTRANDSEQATDDSVYYVIFTR